ncbi:hypothetical protein K5V21_15405 [Clostridium sardiniense]|uniref:Restriction endonuclease n=1 Tax=Clostridium sardiniense TaxID=29369 RepID=A0ABS7L180_CLOSR|nr:hypothetical protein [Clostridium sardiniense]MBY0756830.1 hypothetical protein [Clostridium sardiniense]MDQ0458673.1 hypothetical protein [Clostridium sardiniense]
MIAELHGKISSRGTNLRETLEDNLTGNFFGSLRYIPFSKGIKKILLQVIGENNFNQYEVEEWAERIKFWPYHNDGEVDLVINLKLVTIAIEVKYNSGLSSDDEVLNDDENIEKSRNQLAKESRIVKELAEVNGTNPILLFIAKENEGKEIVSNVINRNIIEEGVTFKFISWEDICLITEEIYKSTKLNYFEKLVIEDIYKLLVRKGFNSFKDFKSRANNKVIGKDKFYIFKVGKNAKYSDKFKFISDVEIEKDGYYEFV